MNKKRVYTSNSLLAKFVWYQEKAVKNIQKHGISFEEAITVFCDPFSLTILDDLHSKDRQRFITIGWSQKKRTLVIVHRDWGKMVNLISARVATRPELKSYEEGNEQAFLFVKNGY